MLKHKVLLGVILLLGSLFSGCGEKQENNYNKSESSYNSGPQKYKEITCPKCSGPIIPGICNACSKFAFDSEILYRGENGGIFQNCIKCNNKQRVGCTQCSYR